MQLGYLYAVGDGLEADAAEAVCWFKLAAEQEDSQAIYNLSQMYQGGHGVEADLTIAIELTKSSECGKASRCALQFGHL